MIGYKTAHVHISPVSSSNHRVRWCYATTYQEVVLHCADALNVATTIIIGSAYLEDGTVTPVLFLEFLQP